MKDKTLLLLFGIFVVVSIGLTFRIVRGTSTCLECRAIWHKRDVAGFDRSYIEHNDYSQFVLQRDPARQHRWCSSGNGEIQDLVSKMHVCGKQHPIWTIPVKIHAAYARTVSREELAATLTEIESKDENVAPAAAERMYSVGGDSFIRSAP